MPLSDSAASTRTSNMRPHVTGRTSRKARVVSQYDTASAAAAYASAVSSPRPSGRCQRSRIYLIQKMLASHPGGDLLDAGCGPGIVTHTLLKTRPGAFRAVALDQSPAMVRYCTDSAGDGAPIRPVVGQLERLPYADHSFDVVLAIGCLEYTNAHSSIREIARVSRAGGLVVISMLNPLSPYRIVEWLLYWPAMRLLGAVEALSGRPAERRHGARLSGIRAFTARRLRRLVTNCGLEPVDLVHYDITPLVPPFDHWPSMVRMTQLPLSRTVDRGWRRCMGTAYILTARKQSHDGAGRPAPVRVARHTAPVS
jgi:ubiquinone/menaquinone biosynthesis C-methylase UbiE